MAAPCWGVKRRYELTDEQWERIRGLLPPERGRKARPAKDNRQMVNAMVWVLRTGAPWRDIPPYYGPWKSVHTRFSRWVAQGVWRKVLAEFRKDADGIAYFVDATIVRAHQDAQGARKKGGPEQSGAPVAERPRRFTLWSTHMDDLFSSR
jgi:transposase